MDVKSEQFLEGAAKGLADPNLQKTLGVFRNFAPLARAKTVERMENFAELKQWAKQAKDHALDNLAEHLIIFEEQVKQQGGHVHWAETPEQLNAIVLDICRAQNAKKVVKGKSMISEECQLLAALTEAGLETIETDLGEYIIQLAEEPPSHIIGPAIHKTVEQVVALFRQHHDMGERSLDTPKQIMAEARAMLREHFLTADVGITGANYLIAETGTVGLVTNEGNGDLCSTLPNTHIVVTSIEKVVPDFATAMAVQKLLVPSATAQNITCYTSFFSGPKREGDRDGPENFHVVLLDNHRSEILNSENRDILRCIRCSACLNHCPIYTRTGGHAYGWVYPGPMGSVWTPLINGLEQTHTLPNACTTCGRCEEVCPMDIPLPKLLRNLRRREQQENLQPKRWVWGMNLYMWLCKHPALYQGAVSLSARLMRLAGKKRGALRSLLLANGWTKTRDFPAPQGRSFMSQYRESNNSE